MSVFKACDIRGRVGSELTPELYARMGRGIARMMGERRSVVVGGDVRLSTPELKGSLVRGLAEGGEEVVDIGIVPTPVVYFAKSHLGADACAIVTASHNPPGYNGLKFMVGDLPVLPVDVERLRRMAEGPEAETAASSASGSVVLRNLTADYEAWVAEAVRALAPEEEGCARRVRVVVDAGNGTVSEVAPRVLGRLAGVGVERLFCDADGRFPNREPNCAVAENLAALAGRVRETGADMGVAFDGDGDRVAFVDESGGVISPDEAIVLLMRFLGRRLAGERVVYDLKCSQVVAREAERLGATPLRERSGHAFIKRRMISEDAFFGVEVSGHYFYRELNGGDDGLFTAMLMIRLLQGSGRALGALRREVPERFITKDVRLPCPRERADAILARVRSAFPRERIEELDGIRVSFPNGWGLLRVSITEPKITLRFEGDDAESLGEVIGAFLALLPELRSQVEAAVRDDQ